MSDRMRTGVRSRSLVQRFQHIRQVGGRISDLRARAWLEAPAWAWLDEGLAQSNVEPGQSRKAWPGLGLARAQALASADRVMERVRSRADVGRVDNALGGGAIRSLHL